LTRAFPSKQFAEDIIDFPQAFDPVHNPDAYPLFARDVERLCQYVARYGIETDARRLAREIWTRYLPAPEEESHRIPS
jgi:RIO kinase 1